MKKIIVLMIALLSLQVVTAFDIEILNTDPAPVIAGEYADVTIKLTDPETKLNYNDVKITMDESEDIEIVGSNVETIGKFSHTESATHTYRVFFSDDIPGGDIELVFTVSSDISTQEIKKSLFVSDSKTLPDIRIGQIESIPDELLEDTDDNKVIITLQNLGETEAELVRAELKYNGQMIRPSSSFSHVDSVASIDAGDEAELEFKIDILEGVKDTIPVSIDLRYRSRQSVTDTYRVFEETIRTNLQLAESPFLRVVNVENAELKTGTTDNEIIVTIKNDGLKEAEDVRIRFHPDISYPFVFDATTHYITSELKPGEEANIRFEVEATNRGTTRAYPISVELQSLVGETLYSRDDSIILNVEESISISNRAIGLGIIGLVILIALGFGINNKRKNKKKK